MPFFVVWSQEACEKDKSGKLARPDNPTVQAMFKPLSKISACFDCDARRTVLIDDSPYKGCASLLRPQRHHDKDTPKTRDMCGDARQ